ncbi:mechanosensitive ion channel family protein [Marinibactrum halimedae]|uniref:Small-conductance mechanosensitive channel n=1 Tax=Marinibactrum halimedae TaxID=1444977 RepID=A0AA37WLQ6_9GAMM|nr:mechanosensitive ion channel domain-containing protein [Marinibactrum halimedae]MCD9457905.1 mechanosensitive ion channel [Marinibactrum halimedae]GLS26269.1 mechanosensitive ion channel protein [Marinibactrum halimedae]
MNVNEIIEKLPGLGVEYTIKIILAVAIFVIGKWLAKSITRLMAKGLEKKGIESTLSFFVTNILYYLLIVVVIIAALGQLGIQTASFVAVIGAAGLAVGLALQGSLSNFAAGVMLILFRPCRVGDYVDVAGVSGTVKEISIFATTLLTVDNKTVIVANSAITSGNIVNYSTQSTRRVDFLFGVSYSADIKKVKSILLEVAQSDERVLKDKEVTCGVVELSDSSVNFVLRPWVKKEDYWGVYFDTMEAVKARLDQEGIEIPFPQMDVHLDK